MLKNLFAKYARAVSDERLRAELYNKFRFKVISLVVFLVLCVAMLVECFFFDTITDPAQFEAAVVAFGITLLLWLAAAVAWIVSAIKFRLTYREILSAPAYAGEMPEVVSYRGKVRSAGKLTKPVIVGIIFLAAGIIFMIAAIFYDVFTNPDSEELGLLTNISIYVFAACLLVFLLAVYFSSYKKSAEGKTVELQTEGESIAIDAAQGREHKYSLREDNNARSLRYLFPDENLRKEAEDIRAKMQKTSLIAVIASAVVALVLCGALFLPFICGFEWSGYCIPIIYVAVAAAAIISSLPYGRKLAKLEKLQKEQLESDPALELNLRVYRLYEAYSKGKGRAIYICCAVALILAILFAALFPETLISLVSIVAMWAGIILNYVFLSQLRKQCLPIEREIDQKTRAEAAADVADGETGESEENKE